MKHSNLKLIVTIDVECDKSPTWRTASPLSFNGVTEGIGQQLHPLFSRYGVRPTYLLSPEIMTDCRCCDLLGNLPHCELGSHLHGDYIVPGIKTWDFPGSLTSEMQWEYSPELEFDKLDVLTELFVQQFGNRPRSFRAGRFGIGHHTGAWLTKLGYKVDTSVTPHVTWTNSQGVKFPDFSNFPEHPYYIGDDGDIWKRGASTLLEIPVTIMQLGGTDYPHLEPAWFRPWYSNAETMIAIMRRMKHQGDEITEPLPLVMMFHNVELVAGASPYPQSYSDVQLYLSILEKVLSEARDLGIESCTLEEYYDEYASYTRRLTLETCPKPCGLSEIRLSMESHYSKELDIPTSLVTEALRKNQAPSWFQYIFEDRANRWDVWRPCFWVAENIPRNAAILSVGCGVGYNLMWFAKNGFANLYGFDIDEKVINSGKEICLQENLSPRLWVDDGLNPQMIPRTRFSVIEALNWTMLVENFKLDDFLDCYLPHLDSNGVIIFDTIDASYNDTPNNQYLTSDWNKPENQRRPSEYKVRVGEAEVINILHSKQLVPRKIFKENESIPRKVFIAQLHN